MRIARVSALLLLVACSKGGDATSGGSDPGAPLPAEKMGALLDGVPEGAIGVAVLGMRQPFWHYVTGEGFLPMDKEVKAEFKKELMEHLDRHFGLDVTGAQAAGLFVLPGERPTGAALVHGVEGKLKGATETHAGGKVLTVDEGEDVVVALREPILLVGERSAVLKSLEVLAGDAKSIEGSELRKRIDAEREDAYFAVAGDLSHPMIAEKIPMGLSFGTASFRFSPKNVRLRIEGDDEALGFLEAQFTLGTQVAIDQLEQQKEMSKEEPLEGLGALIAFYNAKNMIARATPTIEGGALTVELELGSSQAVVMVAIVGMLSAVAIPAFMKYIKKAKTSEAQAMVKRLYDGARVLAVDGKPLPPSVGPTPPLGSCCAGNPEGQCPHQKDLWTGPWQQLVFSMDSPHYYSYEFENDGNSFTARAYGDLDCDGFYSTFEMYGELPSPAGSATLTRSDELE